MDVRASAGPDRRFGVLLAALVLATWWVDVVHWHGIVGGAVHRGLVELRVHSTVEAWSWVGFIQPPGFSLLLHALDAVEVHLGIPAERSVFLLAAVVDTVILVAGAVVVARLRGAGWGLGVGLLLALNPATLRPFEHYPLAQLLGVAAAGALVLAARSQGLRGAVGAGALVLLAAEVHLATLFVSLPVAAGAFHAHPERRSTMVRVAAVTAALFAASTVPDLWIQLRQESVSALPAGDPNVGWSDPVLVAMLAAWSVPALRRSEPAFALLAWGAVGFAGTIWTLQAANLMNGVGFPSGMHYFTLVDPLLAILAGVACSRGGRLGVGALVALVGTHAGFWWRGATVLWGDAGVLLHALAPWRWTAG